MREKINSGQGGMKGGISNGVGKAEKGGLDGVKWVGGGRAGAAGYGRNALLAGKDERDTS